MHTPLRDDRGFTLIELLVVILIIGVLAAIAIPSFLNQRTKANDARAKNDVRNARTAMETYFTDNNNYTGVDAAALRTIEPTLVSASNLTVTSTANTYTITVDSLPTGNAFSMNRAASGSVTRTCTVAGKGGCLAGGSW